MDAVQLKAALEANDAVISIDKPLYWTSFTLVGRVRWAVSRYLGVKRRKWAMPVRLTRWLQEL